MMRTPALGPGAPLGGGVEYHDLVLLSTWMKRIPSVNAFKIFTTMDFCSVTDVEPLAPGEMAAA